MFSRWGRFVYRRRRWVFLAAILIGFGMATFAGRAASGAVRRRLAGPEFRVAGRGRAPRGRLGAGKGTLVLLYLGADGAERFSPAARPSRKLGAGLEQSPLVDAIVGYAQTGDARFVSTNGELRLRRGPAQPPYEASVEPSTSWRPRSRRPATASGCCSAATAR